MAQGYLLNHSALSVLEIEMTDIFGKSGGVTEKRAYAGTSKQDLVADACQLIDRAGCKSHLQSVIQILS